jgi:hypothetical protein
LTILDCPAQYGPLVIRSVELALSVSPPSSADFQQQIQCLKANFSSGAIRRSTNNFSILEA